MEGMSENRVLIIMKTRCVKRVEPSEKIILFNKL